MGNILVLYVIWSTLIGSVSPLVVGGKDAEAGTHPFYVHIQIKTKDGNYTICEGTLIKENVVVTAAHCFKDSENGSIQAKPKDILVAFGLHDISDYDEDLFIQPESIVIHEEYGQGLKYLNDIALLIFNKSLDITKANARSVSTISLWNENDPSPVKSTGRVFGLGRTEEEDSPTVLQMIDLHIVSNEECEQNGMMYHNYLKQGGTFCAGFNKENKCLRKGASGGGLVIKVNGTWFLKGIVSLGPGLSGKDQHCNSNYPIIFLDITHKYRKWIDENSGEKAPHLPKSTINVVEVVLVFLVSFLVTVTFLLVTIVPTIIYIRTRKKQSYFIEDALKSRSVESARASAVSALDRVVSARNRAVLTLERVDSTLKSYECAKQTDSAYCSYKTSLQTLDSFESSV